MDQNRIRIIQPIFALLTLTNTACLLTGGTVWSMWLSSGVHAAWATWFLWAAGLACPLVLALSLWRRADGQPLLRETAILTALELACAVFWALHRHPRLGGGISLPVPAWPVWVHPVLFLAGVFLLAAQLRLARAGGRAR